MHIVDSKIKVETINIWREIEIPILKKIQYAWNLSSNHDVQSFI